MRKKVFEKISLLAGWMGGKNNMAQSFGCHTAALRRMEGGG